MTCRNLGALPHGSPLYPDSHRLLQKDVHFKNLGLLVVDEEQRFGVTHKEKLKELGEIVLPGQYRGGDQNGGLLAVGGGDWERQRSRAKKAVQDLAKGLIQLYAQRQRQPGYAFAPDSPWQKESISTGYLAKRPRAVR